MYAAAIPDPAPEQAVDLATVGTLIDGVASQLDARFVAAGNALAEAYALVEALVAALEAATQALGREAADAAIDNMRATADRLEHLPDVQRARGAALDRIRQTGKPLHDHIARIDRTLDFLRICGLNIKVAAAGAHGFADFADTMLIRLDDGEREIDEIGVEVAQLIGGIDGLVEVDRRLAHECVKVIPQVPRKLAEDAAALQRHQLAETERAGRIAEVARDIRTRVATAIGAMQIGDITRQRLEHVAEGVRALLEWRDGDGDGGADADAGPGADSLVALAVSGHMTALFAAQASDALAAFEQETGLLADSLNGIVPSAETLVALQAGEGSAAGEDGAFLAGLERSVREIAAVTERLREADGQAQRLAAATSTTADSLAHRLALVHRVTSDVQQMAWNTDLRCSRLGNEGRGLAMVATEIRGFARNLVTISHAIEESFGDLAAAAAAIRGSDADGADPDGGDTGQSLAESLACIQEGAERMRTGMGALGGGTTTVTAILGRATGSLDCEAEVGGVLAGAVATLEQLAAPCAAPDAAVEPPLRALLDALSRRYTMAREREIHRRFALPDDAAAETEMAAADAADEDDEDDGLF